MNTEKKDEVTTLLQAYTLYAENFPKKAIQVRTAIVRYLLPYSGFNLGFEVEANKRLTATEARVGLELAKKIKIETLSDIERVLTWQEEVFNSLEISKEIRSPNKHYLKYFLKWCQEHELLKPKDAEDWSIPTNLPSASKFMHKRGSKETQAVINRHSIKEYSAAFKELSGAVQLQLAEYKAFWTEPGYGWRPIPKPIEESTYEGRFRYLLCLLGWLSIDKLEYYHQMRSYALLKKEKKPTYNSDWLLVDTEAPGWLVEMHKKYPPKPVSELRLEDLVPVVETRVSKLVIETNNQVFDNQSSKQDINTEQLLDKIQAELEAQGAVLSFNVIRQLGQALNQSEKFAEEVSKLNQIIVKDSIKEKVQEAAQKAASQTCELLKDFLKWLKYQHNPTNSPDGYRISPNYIANYCNALLSLSKFLYRDITDSRMYPDYKDISVVMAIRAMRNENNNLPFKKNPVNPVKRNPTWKELGQLVKSLLVDCAPRRQIFAKPDYKSYGPLRSQAAVARDFQKYLIVMFFRLIAPDRQHVVRQLRVHDTLKLCWLNWDTGEYEEAPWDSENKHYQVYYNTYTKLYYLDKSDVKDQFGNIQEKPQSKAFEWVVFLNATQTKINKENAYRVPKIYNPELQAWLYGREDYSNTWFNWPRLDGTAQKLNKWSKKQYNWCGYVDVKSGILAGFRDVFNPTHDFVFTQGNGKPFGVGEMCRTYDAIIWRHLGFRANPHAVRKAATSHYKRKGLTHAQNQSLARIKSHSTKMQDSSSYNDLKPLEETELASRMIVNEFLEENGLAPEEYGFV